MKKSELIQLIENSVIRQLRKKRLNESSASDFLDNYATELKNAVQSMKRCSKLYDSNIEKNAEEIENVMDKYDSNVGEQIDRWISGNSFERVNINDIVNFAINNQDRYGTEPKAIIYAIEDFCEILEK